MYIVTAKKTLSYSWLVMYTITAIPHSDSLSRASLLSLSDILHTTFTQIYRNIHIHNTFTQDYRNIFVKHHLHNLACLWMTTTSWTRLSWLWTPNCPPPYFSTQIVRRFHIKRFTMRKGDAVNPNNNITDYLESWSCAGVYTYRRVLMFCTVITV